MTSIFKIGSIISNYQNSNSIKIVDILYNNKYLVKLFDNSECVMSEDQILRWQCISRGKFSLPRNHKKFVV